MRVLVTGAAGRLGSHAVAGLLKLGHDVVATDVNYRHGLPVKLHVADLLDRTAAYGLLEGCDAVAHLGNHSNQHSISPPQRLYMENTTMSMNVFQAAQDMGLKKIIFASSIQAAASRRVVWFPLQGKMPPSPLAHLPFGSATPASPGNHYALSKTAAENMLELLCLHSPETQCASIRFPWIMMPHYQNYHHHRLSTEGRPVMPDEAFSYLMANDAVSLLDAVLRADKPGHRILMPSATENHLNLRNADMMQLFFKGVPLRKPIDPEARTLFDLAEIESLYGWSPKETTPPFNLPRQAAEILKNMLEEAWKTP